MAGLPAEVAAEMAERLADLQQLDGSDADLALRSVLSRALEAGWLEQEEEIARLEARLQALARTPRASRGGRERRRRLPREAGLRARALLR